MALSIAGGFKLIQALRLHETHCVSFEYAVTSTGISRVRVITRFDKGWHTATIVQSDSARQLYYLGRALLRSYGACHHHK